MMGMILVALSLAEMPMHQGIQIQATRVEIVPDRDAGAV